MSELIHYEYAPPRSWEQFEELCADLFEAMWSDPRLARHGRAGQAQYGVDIVASRGSIYPVGLQCKKKARWPIKKLTVAEVDSELEEAEKFRPVLKEYYILTTAPSDERVQNHVRMLNESRKAEGKFQVEIVFWPEIIRRIAGHKHVAQKHFPVGANRKEFSPLLATWYTIGGRLELTGAEWHLAVGEVGEDFQDWPTGRVVVRQRETDDLIAQLQRMDRAVASRKNRETKLALRTRLRHMRGKEQRVQDRILMLYTEEPLRFYMLDLDDKGVDAREILRASIEFEMRVGFEKSGSQKIRLFPPSPHLLPGRRSPASMADADIAVDMPGELYAEILQKERDFPKKYYGNPIVRVVSELPTSIRCRLAIPAVIRRIERIMSDEQKSLAEMRLAGYLDLDSWSYSL